jgi:hypothetical protein
MRFIFHVSFSVSEALPSLENCSLSPCIVSIGLMDELYCFSSTFYKPNTEFSHATLLLCHPKKGFFKITVTKTLIMVRGMKIMPLLHYSHHCNLP